MGIQPAQHMGLNKWAREFVKGEPVLVYGEWTTRVYTDGQTETFKSKSVYESSIKKEESGEFYSSSMLDNEQRRPLHKYICPSGKVYFERIQAEPWSSGPIVFLALQDNQGNWVPESLWAEKTIKTT